MSKTANIGDLLGNANSTGDLTNAALEVLNTEDVGEQIMNGFGMSADDYSASEVVIVAILTDDSGSIEAAGNTGTIIDGHNKIIDDLLVSKNKKNILFHSALLNGKIISDFGLIESATRLSRKNYDPVHGTPLYDNSVVFLGRVLAKAQEFKDNGISVRTIILIVSDGKDLHSVRNKPSDCKKVVKSMQAQECHLVFGMGIDDKETDFNEVFRSMGIDDKYILTPENEGKEIRAAFGLFSQSAVKASQSAKEFSKLAGFTS